MATYCYPGIGGKPIILACVRCLLTGNAFGMNMLLDTGADNTCFPASYAALFGHSNHHPKVEVEKDSVQGIGGFSDAYMHSIRVSLMDPVKSKPGKTVIAWDSDLEKVPFIQKLDSTHGLIGMDIMRHWKEVAFQPNKHGVLIKITI